MDAKDIKIVGMHNVANVCTASSLVIDICGKEAIKKVAMTFGGVEHRMELVREIDGVKWYNDSIASSPSRTIAGLKAFNQKIVLIAGGYDKHIPYEPLGLPLCRRAKTVILTGATADKIREAVCACPEYREGAPTLVSVSDYGEAVRCARKIAKPGDVVLLSPASASFDAFKNFEERGRFFKDEVNKLV